MHQPSIKFALPVTFAMVATLVGCGAPTPAPPERRDLDLFRISRTLACKELPSQGIRPWLHAQIGAATTFQWPMAPMVSGERAARSLLDAQPMLDITDWNCQPLVMASAPDSSLGVAGMLLTLRRPVPTPTERYGRAMGVWRRGPDRWTLEMFAPLNIFDVREVAIPADLPAPAPVQPRTAAAQDLYRTDSLFGMDVTGRGLPASLRSVLAAEAVAFPSSGELHIGVEAITAPLMRIPTDWRWSSVAAGASNDGTLGWTTGTVDAVRHAAGRDAVTIQSKYVAFWKKVDGSWKMIMLGTMPRAAGTN